MDTTPNLETLTDQTIGLLSQFRGDAVDNAATPRLSQMDQMAEIDPELHGMIRLAEQQMENQGLVDNSLDFVGGRFASPLGRTTQAVPGTVAKTVHAGVPAKTVNTKLVDEMETTNTLLNDSHNIGYEEAYGALTDMNKADKGTLAELRNNPSFNKWAGDDEIGVTYHTTQDPGLDTFGINTDNISLRGFDGFYLGEGAEEATMWASRGDFTHTLATKMKGIADSNTIIPDEHLRRLFPKGVEGNEKFYPMIQKGSDKYNKKMAKEYGYDTIEALEKAKPRLFSTKNPTVGDVLRSGIGRSGGLSKETQIKNRQMLEDLGYTGVRNNKELIMFNPNDVKSLKHNSGSFNSLDDNIYKTLLGTTVAGLASQDNNNSD